MTELLIGGYGEGAQRFIVDERGLLAAIGEPIRDLPRASYGAWDRARNVLHIVEESSQGRLSSGRFTSGAWRTLAKVDTCGDSPCFVDLAADGGALAVANYANGSITLYGLDDQGLPAGAPAVQAEMGDGPQKDRQDGPHSHCVRFRQDLLYSVNLGADSVFARTYDTAPARLHAPFVAFAAPAGQGPRQLVFHPWLPVAYILTELGSLLFTLDVEPDGRLVERARCSTLPAAYDGDSLGGHLAFDPAGKRLYVSNRGHDSIALFELGPQGDLTLERIAPSGGASPRHFAFLEGALAIAHEEGDRLVLAPLGADGTVAEPGQTIYLSRPAFITRI